MLVKLFSSKLRVELLALFFTQPESSLYFGEIAKRTAEDRGNISRELRSLEGIGLLVSRKEGNLKYYSLNKGFLLYDELGSMIRKTRGAAARLTEALTKVKGVEYAFLYGSLAAARKRPAATST
jgi:DNA-binding transcriptional ArsR family regulator